MIRIANFALWNANFVCICIPEHKIGTPKHFRIRIKGEGLQIIVSKMNRSCHLKQTENKVLPKIDFYHIMDMEL